MRRDNDEGGESVHLEQDGEVCRRDHNHPGENVKNGSDGLYTGMAATAVAIPAVRGWPTKYCQPFYQRVLQVRLRVVVRQGATTVTVSQSPILIAALAPAAGLAAIGGLYSFESAGGALGRSAVCVMLALPVVSCLAGLTLLRMRSVRLDAIRLPEAKLVITRRGWWGVASETFRRGQVDSLRIAERRDFKGRRHFALELVAEDGFHREVLRDFPPRMLDRAARALRAAMRCDGESGDAAWSLNVPERLKAQAL